MCHTCDSDIVNPKLCTQFELLMKLTKIIESKNVLCNRIHVSVLIDLERK